jgi:hypothetical protein
MFMDLVEIRYVGDKSWSVVTRFLATGMSGIEMREIDKNGPKLTLINNLNKEFIKERTCNWEKEDYEYTTPCGVNFDCDKVTKINDNNLGYVLHYCPNCGGKLDLNLI